MQLRRAFQTERFRQKREFSILRAVLRYKDIALFATSPTAEVVVSEQE
jgi:hypothetical protein